MAPGGRCRVYNSGAAARRARATACERAREAVSSRRERARAGRRRSSAPSLLDALLRRILTSRVYDVARETPLDPAPRLSARLGNDVLLQARGPAAGLQLQAARRLQQDRAPDRRRARARRHHRQRRQPRAGRRLLGAASSGCARSSSCRRRRRQIKVEAVRALRRRGGAGRRQLRRRAGALRRAGRRDRPDVHPPVRRSAGHRRAGHDRRRDPAPQPGPAVARCSCRSAAAACIAGIAGYIKALLPERAGHRRRAVRGRRDVPVARRPAAASRSTTSASSPTASRCARSASTRSRIAQQAVDEIVRVDERRDLRGDQGHLRRHAHVMEPAGALAVAGLQALGRARTARATSTLVAVLSGANMNFDRLRFVAERAELGEAREALLRGDHPRAAGRLPRVLRRARPARRHRVQLPAERPRSEAHIFVGVGDRVAAGRARRWRRSCTPRGYETLDLTDNEMAKLHVRHMVGGARARRARRAALPLRVPGAAGRADAVPRHARRPLEHQPVPLPQPRRRLRPRAGRVRGAGRPGRPRSRASSRRSAIRISASSTTPRITRFLTPGV